MTNALLGNATVRARLWRAADEGRLHHCCIFEGPEGVGKATTAFQLAMYMNCTGESRPCGACGSCKLLLAGSHPDFVRVEPDPDMATRTITIDQARGVIADLRLQRHSARRRVVLIDPVDTLGEAAANALLKTFEEPPPATQFILVTARAGALLQTVRSRSQRVRFGPVPRAELAAWLVERGLDPTLADDADGSPGLALRLAEGEGAARAEVEAALLAVLGQPLGAVFSFAEANGKKEEGVSAADKVIDALEAILRDVVRLGAGRAPRRDHPAVPRLVAALYPEGVARLDQQCALARDRLRFNVGGRVVLEALFTAINLELSAARRT